jgi:hypothetical protein
MSKAATHLLRQMQRDPRLAYLIGPGSQSYDLITAEVAQAEAREVKELRAEVERDLKTTPWPDKDELVEAIKILLGDSEQADYMSQRERESYARDKLKDMGEL